jgi:hypothetical protein
MNIIENSAVLNVPCHTDVSCAWRRKLNSRLVNTATVLLKQARVIKCIAAKNVVALIKKGNIALCLL